MIFDVGSRSIAPTPSLVASAALRIASWVASVDFLLSSSNLVCESFILAPKLAKESLHQCPKASKKPGLLAAGGCAGKGAAPGGGAEACGGGCTAPAAAGAGSLSWANACPVAATTRAATTSRSA